MGEALAAASSIAGLVSLCGSILAEGYTFIASAHKAPRELKKLLRETATIDTVLDQLQSLADESHGAALQRQVEAGTIDECKDSLILVQRSINRCRQVKGDEIKNFGRRIIWPFQEKETKEALAKLARTRDHLATALTVDIACVDTILPSPWNEDC